MYFEKKKRALNQVLLFELIKILNAQIRILLSYIRPSFSFDNSKQGYNNS